MQITFWGVRGSYPAPRADALAYGGNTTCLEVQVGGSRVIVDAGTGIYALGQQLAGEPAHHHLLFTHVHWDHIQGLPFFAPLEDPDSRLTLYALPQHLLIIEALFTDGFRQIYLPIPAGRRRAQVEFKPFHTGMPWILNGLEISSVRLNHPNFASGFRFRADGKTVVFYSDVAPFTDMLFGYTYRPQALRPDEPRDRYEQERLAKMRQTVVEHCQHADVLIYDAHFTQEEYQRFPHFGHSTTAHALEIAREAQVKRLIMTHHSPTRKDKKLTEMEAHYRALAAEHGIDLHAGRELERIIL